MADVKFSIPIKDSHKLGETTVWSMPSMFQHHYEWLEVKLNGVVEFTLTGEYADQFDLIEHFNRFLIKRKGRDTADAEVFINETNKQPYVHLLVNDRVLMMKIHSLTLTVTYSYDSEKNQ